MSIYSIEELDAEIAAYKKGLTGLASAERLSINIGGNQRELTRSKMGEYREHLLWLDSQRSALVGGSSNPPRRTYAKNGGRG